MLPIYIFSTTVKVNAFFDILSLELKFDLTEILFFFQHHCIEFITFLILDPICLLPRSPRIRYIFYLVSLQAHSREIKPLRSNRFSQ